MFCFDFYFQCPIMFALGFALMPEGFGESCQHRGRDEDVLQTQALHRGTVTAAGPRSTGPCSGCRRLSGCCRPLSVAVPRGGTEPAIHWGGFYYSSNDAET